MNRLMISAAAAALCVGMSAAYAQDQTTTTTTVDTPSATTTTRTTEGTDEYGNFRKTVTSTKRYHAAAWEAPSGVTYRRFTVGQHVPDAMLADSVQLNNYQDYALVTPPPGLIWIRDGKDALLVDNRTGEVIQADYDLFD
ncbi:MAG TPA: RcnB family protein [Bauldia sp.]|nr:RcnB family protein [Bauldia sp.]